MRCRDRQFGNWPTTRSVNDTRDSSSPVCRHRARPAQDRRINKDQGRELTPPSGSFFDWKRVVRKKTRRQEGGKPGSREFRKSGIQEAGDAPRARLLRKTDFTG